MPSLKLSFKHKLFTSRVPLNENIQINTDEWVAEQHEIEYGVVHIDEYLVQKEIKIFQFKNTKTGDRFRYVHNRRNLSSEQKYMMVAILKHGTDVTFDPDVPFNQKLHFPLKDYQNGTSAFDTLLAHYQLIVAKCTNNQGMQEQCKDEILESQIVEAQGWLDANYRPSKPKLERLLDCEFERLYSFFKEEDVEKFMREKNHKSCLSYYGTFDSKTLQVMFKRSTKLTGKNIRRNSMVKELMYQFLLGDMSATDALYKDYDKCLHKNKCVNPYHFFCGRKQQYNTRVRKRAMEDQKEESDAFVAAVRKKQRQRKAKRAERENEL